MVLCHRFQRPTRHADRSRPVTRVLANSGSGAEAAAFRLPRRRFAEIPGRLAPSRTATALAQANSTTVSRQEGIWRGSRFDQSQSAANAAVADGSLMRSRGSARGSGVTSRRRTCHSSHNSGKRSRKSSAIRRHCSWLVAASGRAKTVRMLAATSSAALLGTSASASRTKWTRQRCQLAPCTTAVTTRPSWHRT